MKAKDKSVHQLTRTKHCVHIYIQKIMSKCVRDENTLTYVHYSGKH